MTPAELTQDRKSFTDGVQLAWDSTSLNEAQTCPRKYYYSIIRQLSPKEKSVHLIFGGLYASALESFHKYRAVGLSHENALIEVVTHAMIDSWDHKAGHAMVFDDPRKTRLALIRTIVWYIEQFGHETEGSMSVYQMANGKPAVELSFSFELSDDFLYCGHLDTVVDFADSLYVVDQKTTGGTVGTYFFDQFHTSNQMSGYTLAGQIVLGSPVRGVIIDAAQIAVNFTRFERGITTRSKNQLNEWIDNTIYTIKQFQSYSLLNTWPMNLTACGNYGGCPFRVLCSRDPGIREQFVKAEFVQRGWDPLVPR